MSFTVTAIAPAVVRELLVQDDAGRPPRLLTDDEGGNPLRCCLRASRPGEHVALVSYAPLRRWAAARGVHPGPYDETGPVFVHAEPCAGRRETGYPDELRGAPRVLRAYGHDGRILRGREVGPDDDPEPVLERLLADPSTAVVHVRAVVFGCFTFAVEPPTPPPPS
jgi:hypothetical protein